MNNPAEADPREGATILLVDDNKHGLIARKTVLQQLNYRVATASNGEEALELFRQQHFDLVITDQRMPRMTGMELIRTLREMGSRVPIILLSGFVEPLGLDERSTGADVVIAKSVNEVGHLIRASDKLLNPRGVRKPPRSQKAALKARAEGAS